MQDLSAQRFFDLDGFDHPDLFADGEPVWAALARIKDYVADRVQAGRREGEVHPTAVLIGDVEIGPDTVVAAGAVIEGPAILGQGCDVRPHAYIRGGNLIGDGAVVGHATELKNTLLFPKAHAPHFNYCGDAILGFDCNLGAGTKLSNVRLDKRNVQVKVDGRRVDSGLRKFAAIVGDRAQTGCNAVLNPGTLLLPGAFVFPCASVDGLIEPRE